MARNRTKQTEALPHALVRLIHAATKAGSDADGVDLTGTAEALRDLGQLALWTLPVQGVFVVNNNDVDVRIARIASEHLGLKKARHEFSKALAAVDSFERREPIESAQNHIHTITDAAYYYAGLAFGITLTHLS